MGSGKQIEDNCEIVAKLPEMLNLGGAAAANTANAPGQWRPAQFCHREEPMLTGFKALAIYIIPKIDVQVSGSFRSTPGTSLSVGYTATNAILGTSSTLGRALSGTAPNMVIGIEKPNEAYTERRQELDMRIGKVLRFGNTKTVVSMDLYNALNSNAMIVQNQAYVSYLRPGRDPQRAADQIQLGFRFLIRNQESGISGGRLRAALTVYASICPRRARRSRAKPGCTPRVSP